MVIMIATLWVALGLLAVASILPKTFNSRFLFGDLGWLFLWISGLAARSVH